MSSKKVDDFLSGLTHPLKEEMQTIRKIIMEVDTAITEEVKWGGPSFYYKGDIATFSPRIKDQAVLVFHRGEMLSGRTALEPAPKGKAYAKFSNMAEIEAKSEDLRAVIKEWIQLMDET
ncbi:DUF1801 domain-containing protein [Dyadobacter fanqingshengii]|uniref:DUF1801 domain-containing protein n=1 Tax=Dyadobacter fanqingshengii TaxID=2906443 RepID=A0A9X1PAI5_9BACT|nr:DUF1801 domain-containing protein [Dyadobacter fanqingshengii]MCF0040363.1 DUF1801 domain-containing protein [Dyadobacter fanqingshengii]USJ37895.1 DUF1801 domain-containing protein [Dyadobacter fanqingshengii]